MWDRYRLFLEKQSLGSSTSWVELVNTSSMNSIDKAARTLLEHGKLSVMLGD